MAAVQEESVDATDLREEGEVFAKLSALTRAQLLIDAGDVRLDRSLGMSRGDEFRDRHRLLRHAATRILGAGIAARPHAVTERESTA